MEAYAVKTYLYIWNNSSKSFDHSLHNICILRVPTTPMDSSNEYITMNLHHVSLIHIFMLELTNPSQMPNMQLVKKEHKRFEYGTKLQLVCTASSGYH